MPPLGRHPLLYLDSSSILPEPSVEPPSLCLSLPRPNITQSLPHPSTPSSLVTNTAPPSLERWWNGKQTRTNYYHNLCSLQGNCLLRQFIADDSRLGMYPGHSRNAMVRKERPHIDWGRKTITFDNEHIWKTALSTELTITTHKEEVSLPSQYADYADIFSKRTFDVLPPRWEFDHPIKLKESFIPKVAKVYPLNP